MLRTSIWKRDSTLPNRSLKVSGRQIKHQIHPSSFFKVAKKIIKCQHLKDILFFSFQDTKQCKIIALSETQALQKVTTETQHHQKWPSSALDAGPDDRIRKKLGWKLTGGFLCQLPFEIHRPQERCRCQIPGN